MAAIVADENGFELKSGTVKEKCLSKRYVKIV